ncbi:MAG: diphthamide biosynthesis enzyme Dph2 [Candidatus Aenigmarchaeota archaeon]|nr:diphthamide biosynthesis enzyme Dph2 [Candidatus Aenigmarchaeota archaeon]
MLSDETIKKIKESGAKKIFVQIPEGLKMTAISIAKRLENSGLNVLVSAEPCYGACDLKDSEAKRLKCDLLLHIGHSNFGLKTEVPVIYEEYKIKYDLEKLLKKHLKQLEEYKNISLLTTIQFLDSLEGAKMFLENHGKKIVSSGQILGCKQEAAIKSDKETDCHLFIGSGLFHPIGILEKTKKPVLFLDIETETIKDLTSERNKMLIKRQLRIEKAKDCKIFGILVSTKPGQSNPRLAETIKKKLERKGKEAYILVMDEITPEKILGIKVECLVNTACPRISGDSKRFGKVILSSEDVDFV